MNEFIERQGTNEIIFNVNGSGDGAGKFDYCISYITFNCFSIIIVFKYNDDLRRVTKV